MMAYAFRDIHQNGQDRFAGEDFDTIHDLFAEILIRGIGSQVKDIDSMVDEKELARKEAMILSMTPKERSNPDILNPSRKARIAKGAGVDVAEVNRMVKQFEQAKKMMKQMPGLMGGKGGKRGRFKLPF